jgi:ABC-2 type transport system permease protein
MPRVNSTRQIVINRVRAYSGFAAIVPKNFLAYSIWVWTSLFVNLVAMLVFVAFWQVIYVNQNEIAGLTLRETLNYALLTQIFASLGGVFSAISVFGRLLNRGELAIVLLRPVDFQLSMYITAIVDSVCDVLLRIPLLFVALLFFGLTLPADPLVWGAFLVTALLGMTVMFCFEWLIGCLAFYTTEIWGLSVLRYGFTTFLSGALVPLAMLPDSIRPTIEALPFAQAFYIPLTILSGITPASEAPRLWLTQIAWIAGLLLCSRLAFNHAIRKVTVQGG